MKTLYALMGLRTLLPFLVMLTISPACFSNGKLLATAGTSSLEGSGGGGMTPWAVLSGYGAQDELSVSGYITQIDLSDFTMQSYGVATSYDDRAELSFSRQTIQGKQAATPISMNTAGLKVRVYGDAVYSTVPQFSIGIQHKELLDSEVANLLGAKKSSGTDFYVSATKIWLNGFFHRNVFLNLTLRNTDANQLGLLGFGGDKRDRSWHIESSAGVLINRYWGIGTEYRSKPNNLSSVEEDHWKDVFIAYFPSKNVSLTLAYLELGDIAGATNQVGTYLSLQGVF